MKRIQARTAEPKDAKNYIDWLQMASDINLVDWDVYRYPCLNTIVVDRADEPVLMNSFHPVLVMEALAPKPGLSPRDEARALVELYDAIRKVSLATGIREVMFQCADERLFPFIEKRGFRRVNTPVFKMRVGTADDPLNQ
jgi:hypothetical protein